MGGNSVGVFFSADSSLFSLAPGVFLGHDFLFAVACDSEKRCSSIREIDGGIMMRKMVLSSLAGISLLCCLASPLLFFWGMVSEKDYKGIFLLASIFWFLFATLRALIKQNDKRTGGNIG